ncbi:bifunctional methylenetetrahydrofolate dehydrogenase/methenyltetrahydrofolate cyclohydrolase FolD [bacterium]|nr:MAG: bifunctional methylenetetrahydrofolate dehydrogenase/methenyltetrahydrofolate cyclohydrolase FolD [bacterium]RKZ16880.1 MAG: bifunctional methylenetetrahydrofolate dehydrogenase/methenyltetrahydrofolate cyclohydrolase FolD [bacterium]
MTQAERMDGKALAKETRESLAVRVEALTKAHGRAPALTVVLVGSDPASEVYVRNKHQDCQKVGITSAVLTLDEQTSSDELKAAVEGINQDPDVDGLIVQLPVPDHIDPADVRAWIDPLKDVDGLNPENVGLLACETPRFIPCTPLGCVKLLQKYGVQTTGKHAVVIGRSLIVGRPMATLLSTKGIDCTVTICHSRTPDTAELCRQADIVVAAAGVPQFVKPDWIRPGAVVIDVGIHRIEDPTHPKGARLVGDVHPDVANVASHLTPVPGGVGPMTRALLLENTVRAFENRYSDGS